MSAQRKPQSETKTEIIDWSQWIAIDEAARRLKMEDRTLRRKCSEALSGSSDLARMMNPPGGGRPKWFIRRAWRPDELFDGTHTAALLDNDELTQRLEQATEKQRTLAYRRAECVRLFKHHKSTHHQPVKRWINNFIDNLNERFEGITVSQGSLYRWCSKYDEEGEAGLLDTRGGDTLSRGSNTMWDYFESIFLDDRKPSVANCWRRAKRLATDQGDEWCSLSSCRRQLDERIAPIKQMMHRDPAKYRKKHASYIQQDSEHYATARCWVGDHSQLDLFCWYKGKKIRPWITAWQDWRTRKIVGYELCASPSSATILKAFSKGMRDESNFGGPSEVFVDNGKDYTAWTFTGMTKKERHELKKGYIDEPEFKGLYGGLKIQVHFSLPHNPTGKPRMERWFGTMHDQFDRTFPTYCGNKPEERPESLKKILQDERNIPTFDQINYELGLFIIGFNNNADHQVEDMADLVDMTGKKLSPVEYMNKMCESTRVYDKAALDLFMMTWARPQKVGRNGVTVKTAKGKKFHYGAHNHAIMRHRGRGRVMVSYNEDDLSEVTVYTMTLSKIGVAEINDRNLLHGLKPTREHVSNQMKRKRQFEKSLKFTRENRELQYKSDAQLLAEEIINNQDTPHRPLPDPDDSNQMQLISTPLDGGGDYKEPGSMAAGAETLDTDDADDMVINLAKYRTPTDTPDDQDEPEVLDISSSRDEEPDFDEDMDVLDLSGDIQGSADEPDIDEFLDKL